MYLTLLLGTKGSGKTLMLTIFALMSNKEIYSNFEIKSKKYHKLELIKILNIPDNVDIFIDEAHLLIDSRRSQNIINLTISDINSLSRKTFTDLHLATLEFTWIDNRLRESADYLVFCKSRRPYSQENFEFLFYERLTDTWSTWKLKYNEAKQYFRYFRTYDIIERHNKAEREFKLLQQNPEQMLKKVIKIIANLDFLSKTHEGIKQTLFLNGYHVGYERYIYLYLNKQIKI